jgi:hypothetical protein
MTSPKVLAAGLSQLFAHTANAAARSQLMLDTYSLERNHVFAIPSVAVQTSFDLQVDARTGLLALLFGSGSQQTRHRLQFAVRTVPVHPVDDLPSDLPDNRRAVYTPRWMVPMSERQRLAHELATALRTNRWILQVPGLSGAADLSSEASAIDEAMRNTEDGETGVVFLRLSDVPARYLVVRVGENGNDGIFVLSPADPAPVTIFDFLWNPEPSIDYRPIDQAVTVLSQWQAAGLPSRQLLAGDIPATFGSIRFAEFARDMWSSYVAVRKSIVAVDPGKKPVYALTEVKAQFAHAVPPPGERAGAGEASPYISSRVDLDIAGDHLSERLVCPEYVLAEDARDAFLAQLASGVDEIAAVAEDDEEEIWRAALKNPASRARAVVTLSYRGTEPRNQFLAVLPGDWAGRQSWFAFTCGIDKQGLKDIRRSKGLADITLDREDYMGFHNFWHSILVWEMAKAGFTDQ